MCEDVADLAGVLGRTFEEPVANASGAHTAGLVAIEKCIAAVAAAVPHAKLPAERAAVLAGELSEAESSQRVKLVEYSLQLMLKPLLLHTCSVQTRENAAKRLAATSLATAAAGLPEKLSAAALSVVRADLESVSVRAKGLWEASFAPQRIVESEATATEARALARAESAFRAAEASTNSVAAVAAVDRAAAGNSLDAVLKAFEAEAKAAGWPDFVVADARHSISTRYAAFSASAASHVQKLKRREAEEAARAAEIAREEKAKRERAAALAVEQAKELERKREEESAAQIARIARERKNEADREERERRNEGSGGGKSSGISFFTAAAGVAGFLVGGPAGAVAAVALKKGAEYAYKNKK